MDLQAYATVVFKVINVCQSNAGGLAGRHWVKQWLHPYRVSS